MKIAPEVRDAIRTAYNVHAQPRLTAEWNMNRYFKTVVDNTPSEDTDGEDIEMFPIESIVDPLRPTKGISKARVDASVIADNYEEEETPRFYLASVDDKFKYWVSPKRSNASGVLVDCKPHVIYSEQIDVNKIVVKLENTWASPTDWFVDITTDGLNWTRAATNPTIHPDGQTILYWNGSGWSSTKPAVQTAMRNILGVRVTVNALGPGKDKEGNTTYHRVWDKETRTSTDVPTTGANSHFSLIEISARREVDLTDKLVDVNDTFDAGDTNFLTPMGTITTNDASLNLWNGDNLFSKDNEASPYHKILEPNVEMNLEYIFTVNGIKYPVQEFRMFVDRWTGAVGHQATVELSDASKFLKEMTPPALLLEEVTLKEIVFRLCDSVGFNNFKISKIREQRDFLIPVWWTDGEQSVWEVIDELAKATQSLVYFDAWGVLQVRPREAGFNPNKQTAWTLRGERAGTELADIVTLEQESEYEANLVKVAYKTTRWSKWNNGQPSLETAWEPEGVVTLRSSLIQRTIDASGKDFIVLKPKDVKIWPYDGLVNIEGEFIRYQGKEYIYFERNETTGVLERKRVWAESKDDIEKSRRRTPQRQRHRNHYTGRMKITERGEWNTRERQHEPKPHNYHVRRVVGSNNITSKKGYSYNKNQSTITLSSAGKLKKKSHRLVVTTGNAGEVGKYQMYGTRIKFNKGPGNKHQVAGLVIHNHNNDENGYYIELTPIASKKEKQVKVYSRNAKNVNGSGGSASRTSDRFAALDGQERKKDTGTKADVRQDKKKDKKKGANSTKKKKKKNPTTGQEYDLDVWIKRLNSGGHNIKVWLNGKEMADVVFKGDEKQDFNTKFGFYIRGKTRATFEYLYAIEESANLAEPPDDMSFFDRIRGGYYGSFADRRLPHRQNNKFRNEKRKSTKRKNNKPNFYFDEFGAMAHEVREFDVKFTDGPVQHSRLYMTNDWSAVCTEYNSTPFNAKFVIANAARQNAVVNGTESLSQQGGGREVEHRLHVIGRPLIIDEEEEITRKNHDQIKSRGEIEVQFTSDWIQSKGAAKTIGDWILNHWSTGVDSISATVFGNPLFEVGDIVEIDFPEKSMDAGDSRYFVTGVSNAFSMGLATSLTLRRVAEPVV